MALINTTTTGIQGSTFVADGTGSLTVQQNGQTLGVFGNQPAFSAYATTNTSLAEATYTKITLSGEEFDTNNNFASSRFTPTVAGYYQINGCVFITYDTTSPNLVSTQIFKNGAIYKSAYLNVSPGSGRIYGGPSISAVVYLNGSTDYVELYARQSAGTAVYAYGADPSNTYFSGCLLRSA